MTTVTKLALTTEDIALSETFETLPDLEMRVKSVVTEGAQQTMPLIWITSASKPEIEAAVDTDSSVNQYSYLLEDSDANKWLYRIEYASDVEDICSPTVSRTRPLKSVSRSNS